MNIEEGCNGTNVVSSDPDGMESQVFQITSDGQFISTCSNKGVLTIDPETKDIIIASNSDGDCKFHLKQLKHK